MIRNACAKLLLAPGIRRQRRQIYAAGAAISGAGVTFLTTTCYLSTPKQALAQHVLATSPSSPTNSNSPPVSAPADLIVPTLQASGRALNLIATVCAMVMDYEQAKVQRSLLSGTPDSLLLPLGLIGPQSSEE